jgi:hypothetical protein
MSREFYYRWGWPLRSSPDALWPLVADTNRFDRDVGLPPVERLPRPGADDRKSGHRVRTRFGGIRIEWDEKPFEWVRPQQFEVVREYLSGPLKNLRVLVKLMPGTAGGTQLALSDMVAATWPSRRAPYSPSGSNCEETLRQNIQPL